MLVVGGTNFFSRYLARMSASLPSQSVASPGLLSCCSVAVADQMPLFTRSLPTEIKKYNSDGSHLSSVSERTFEMSKGELVRRVSSAC